MKKKLRSALAVGALAAGVVGVAAAPAQAADNSLLITRNGEWKAFGYVDLDQRRICARVYNAVPDAWAYMNLYQDGYNVGSPLDRGGDTENACGFVPWSFHSGPATLELVFKASNGVPETKRVSTYIY